MMIDVETGEEIENSTTFKSIGYYFRVNHMVEE